MYLTCWSFFCYSLHCILSSFAILLTRKRELVALLLLYFGCLVTVNVLKLFLTVLWVGLQCVIVVFPDTFHLFCSFGINVQLYFLNRFSDKAEFRNLRSQGLADTLCGTPGYY